MTVQTMIIELLTAHPGGLNKPALLAATGVAEETLRRYIRRMRKGGRIKQAGMARYSRFCLSCNESVALAEIELLKISQVNKDARRRSERQRAIRAMRAATSGEVAVQKIIAASAARSVRRPVISSVWVLGELAARAIAVEGAPPCPRDRMTWIEPAI